MLRLYAFNAAISPSATVTAHHSNESPKAKTKKVRHARDKPSVASLKRDKEAREASLTKKRGDTVVKPRSKACALLYVAWQFHLYSLAQ